MPPRPLHRWKSFWLGWLVLIFLGWSWVRSVHHEDDIYYKVSAASVIGCGGTEPGVLWLGWLDDPFEPEGVEFSSTPAGSGTNGFPEAVALTGGRDWEELRIAHWFLILVFLVPWAGFLFWRVRRMRRLGVRTL